MKKIIEHSILIVLLIPLLFINIRSSHDWGDDFAQYIHQAQNIVSGVSQNETGYIFNDQTFIGPQAYPTGFPLLLSGVVAFAGIDIYSMNILMSVFLILSAFVGYLILRFHTSYLAALFATLIIVYNPSLLVFKTEILSDLPYTFFSLLCLYLFYKKESLLVSILIGILIGFSIHIRSIGFVLVITVILYRIFSNGFNLKNNGNLIISLLTMIVVYYGLKFAFPCDTNYPISFDVVDLWFNANNQISYNFEKLNLFFRNFENPNFNYVGIIASSCLIAFALFGFLLFLKTKLKTPIILYFVLYVFTVILFQFGNAGIRFLFPVLIFIFLFAIEGLKIVIKPLIHRTKWLPLLGILVLFSYSSEMLKIVGKQNLIQDGPQSTQAQTMFKFINDSIDQKSVIAFDKPRLLALYAGRKSVRFSSFETYLTAKSELKKFNVNYILIGDTPDFSSQKSFMLSDSSYCIPVFSDQGFSLYKVVMK